jgi:poly(3-hydroxybutyrate) depolymerase
MHRPSVRSAFVLLATAAVAVACGSSRSGDEGGSGGATAGSAGFATPATGGGGGSGAAGTAGTGPDAGAAGGAAGGLPTAGAGGVASAGSGGASAAGSGAAGLGGSGGATGAKPSAGCAKASPRPNGGAIVVTGDHYVTFPATYDGKQPFPVFIGFHGCGAGNRGTGKDDTEWISLSKGTGFETQYVRAVPVSSDAGGCWSYANDVPRVVKMLDDLRSDFCIDEGRIFATGHSSGAQLVVQILTDKHVADAKRFAFKAVAPVAASDYGPIGAPIPILYIQGRMDQERGGGDGHETVARFRAANGCGDASTPYASVTSCKSQNGGVAVNPGCVSYGACQAATVWCSHDDPFYGGTMHGVPCFAMKAMFDFFQGQR